MMGGYDNDDGCYHHDDDDDDDSMDHLEAGNDHCRCQEPCDPLRIFRLTLQALRHYGRDRGASAEEVVTYLRTAHDIPIDDHDLLQIVKFSLQKGVSLGFIRRCPMNGRYSFCMPTCDDRCEENTGKNPTLLQQLTNSRQCMPSPPPLPPPKEPCNRQPTSPKRCACLQGPYKICPPKVKRQSPSPTNCSKPPLRSPSPPKVSCCCRKTDVPPPRQCPAPRCPCVTPKPRCGCTKPACRPKCCCPPNKDGKSTSKSCKHCG